MYKPGVVACLLIVIFVSSSGCAFLSTTPKPAMEPSITEIPTLPEQYVAQPAGLPKTGAEGIGATANPNTPPIIASAEISTINETSFSNLSGSSSSKQTPIEEFPGANFTSNRTSGIAPLTIQFSGTSQNTAKRWYWEFGDGSTSTLQNPVHTFTSGGEFRVRFTAINRIKASTVNHTISVDAPGTPDAQFIANTTEGLSPLTVQFLDKSLNLPNNWSWDFGDGSTSTLQNPVHTFYEGRDHNIVFTAINPAGSRKITKVITVSKPVTHFTSNATQYAPDVMIGYAPLTVQFTDTSINSARLPTDWLWTFNDGSSSALQNPIHTFYDGRNYSVVFRVESRAGSSSETQTVSVYKPDFRVTPRFGGNPLAVGFNNTGIGYPEPTEWYWDFGDGKTSAQGYDINQPNQIHQYVAPGTYDVSLRITGPAGIALVNKPAVVTVT